jgi:secondary thiamine-phosphate synthase enzyme
MKLIHFSSKSFEDICEITDEVHHYIESERIKDGEILLQTPENTVGLTFADPQNPSIAKDYLKALDHVVPRFNGMQYTGPATPGIKAALVGQSLRVSVHEGSLILGLHQGIFAADFGGPKEDRMIFISHMGTTFGAGETPQGSELLRQFNQKIIDEERAAAEEEKRIIEEMRREYRETHADYFKEEGESILKNHMKPKNRKK